MGGKTQGINGFSLTRQRVNPRAMGATSASQVGVLAWAVVSCCNSAECAILRNSTRACPVHAHQPSSHSSCSNPTRSWPRRSAALKSSSAGNRSRALCLRCTCVTARRSTKRCTFGSNGLCRSQSECGPNRVSNRFCSSPTTGSYSNRPRQIRNTATGHLSPWTIRRLSNTVGTMRRAAAAPTPCFRSPRVAAARARPEVSHL